MGFTITSTTNAWPPYTHWRQDDSLRACRRGLEQQIAEHDAKRTQHAAQTRQEAAAIEQSLQVHPHLQYWEHQAGSPC